MTSYLCYRVLRKSENEIRRELEGEEEIRYTIM